MLLTSLAVCFCAGAAALPVHAKRSGSRVARAGAVHAAIVNAVSNAPGNRFGGTPLRPDEDDEWEGAQWPVELIGPWEVRSSLSGVEETWLELIEDGSVGTSTRAFGRGRLWRATPRAGVNAGWDLIVTVENKLRSPLRFEGRVRTDEYKGLSLTGQMLTPNKRTGASSHVGDFRAWKR